MSTTDKLEMLKELENELASVSVDREALARRESALQKAVAGVRELISLNGGSVPEAVVRPLVAPDAFVDLGNLEAAIKYLKIVGKARTNREIVNALISGGKTSAAKSFPDMVRTTLLREAGKPNGRLVWKAPNWSLREWEEK